MEARLSNQVYQSLRAVYDAIDISKYQRLHTIVDQLSGLGVECEPRLKEQLSRMDAAIDEWLANGSLSTDVQKKCKEILCYNTLSEVEAACRLLDRGIHPIRLIVTDVDETLRWLRGTDNEIPEATIFALKRLYHRYPKMRFIINTGQTLENIQGLIIQAFGREMVGSGRFSIIYEQGAGIFTPGGEKILLYAELDEKVLNLFDRVEKQISELVTRELAGGYRDFHLKGSEFNITLKPNDPDGSQRALEASETMMRALLRGLATVAAETIGEEPNEVLNELTAHYRRNYPWLNEILEPSRRSPVSVSAALEALLDEIDLIYFPADAVGLVPKELNKAAGLVRAIEALKIEHPCAAILGDHPADLEMMTLAMDRGWGIPCCPDEASEAVLDFVRRQDGIVYRQGQAAFVFNAVYAFNLLRSKPEPEYRRNP
ncbi:MAG: HAD family hydrolase [Candidatus Bipolaricaulia bacterium]